MLNYTYLDGKIAASISLTGDIGVNYYVQLSDDIAADAGSYMQFTVAGQTQTIPLSEAITSTDEDGVTTYRFTCKVAAKQMTDTILGQMYTSSGPVGESRTYSVKAYCDAAIPYFGQYESYASLIDLMKAMLNYGAYSQIQFDYYTQNLANAGLEDTSLPELTAEDLAAYAHGATGSEDGISISSVSLLLESTTTIRFYFKLDGTKSIDEYTFYANGTAVTPVQSGENEYYVDKENVAAKELDEMATVTVGGLTVQYCGLSYVRQVAVNHPENYSESLVNVAKALYAYNQAANAYFK